MMYMMTPEQHAQIVDALSDERYVVRYSQIAEAIAMLKAMQPVSQEPIAYFDFQKNRFRWATTTSIGPVPVTYKIVPMPLYSAPTHIGNGDSLHTSQERANKDAKTIQMPTAVTDPHYWSKLDARCNALEFHNKMLLEALKRIDELDGYDLYDAQEIARAAIAQAEKGATP